MPFGSYKGIALANVPAGTLIYYYENFEISEPMKEYIRENLEDLKAKARRSNKFNAR